LKRAPHEPYFPNVFELPSGKVDPDGPTLKHALAREVREETGLDVTKILAELKPMVYITKKTIVDGGV
jgi:8-oxo-dGTP pyrophosphatase MutT (NUDIX family)